MVLRNGGEKITGPTLPGAEEKTQQASQAPVHQPNHRDHALFIPGKNQRHTLTLVPELQREISR